MCGVTLFSPAAVSICSGQCRQQRPQQGAQDPRQPMNVVNPTCVLDFQPGAQDRLRRAQGRTGIWMGDARPRRPCCGSVLAGLGHAGWKHPAPAQRASPNPEQCPWLPKATHRKESEAKQGDQASQKPCNESPKGGDQHLPRHPHHSCAGQGSILDLNLREWDMVRGTSAQGQEDLGFTGDQTGS